jgi:hypothetical protein
MAIDIKGLQVLLYNRRFSKASRILTPLSRSRFTGFGKSGCTRTTRIIGERRQMTSRMSRPDV